MRFIAALLCMPSLALACGGLFCEVGANAAPVDQADETILFEISGGTICAHVTIGYTGEADQFAWLVPVPETPEIAESDPEMFRELLGSTDPTVYLPSDITDCGRGGGCIGDVDGEEPEVGPGAKSVQVLATTQTENYEANVVLAADVDDLVEWLRGHQYNISDNMRPALAAYVDEHMKFVAVRLRDGRSAARVRPIRMCYPAFAPSIPLRLTAVAAQPLMGIRVFVLGDHPYVPYEHAAPTPDEGAIGFDATGNLGYAAWVARATDEADGRLFVTEYRGNYRFELPDCRYNADCGEGGRCVGLEWGEWGTCDRPKFDVRPSGYLSRYYTRLSPHHMRADPFFVPAPDALRFNGIVNLSDQANPVTCDGVDSSKEASRCTFTYCGLDATCHVDGGAVGCECPADFVAQQIVAPNGEADVTCVPRTSPFAVTDETIDASPCDALACGAGKCVLRGGFRACQCDDGHMAMPTERGVVCAKISKRARSFGPGAGPESLAPFTATVARSVKRSGSWIGLWFLFGLWILRRQRR